MKILVNMMLLVLVPVMAQAQINKVSGDLLFTTNGSEVARITAAGVLEVSSAIKLENNTTTCDGTIEGVLRYDTVVGIAQICDGTMWKTLRFE
jgi:hypothetical protein